MRKKSFLFNFDMIFTDEYFDKLSQTKLDQLRSQQKSNDIQQMLDQIVSPSNLKRLQEQMKNQYFSKIDFVDYMIDFFQPNKSEFLFFIVDCIQLFDRVKNQYTNCEKISFKYLLNFCLDFDKFNKKFETQFQYQLCANQSLLDPYQKHFFDVHFNAPIQLAKNPLQYISLDLNSLRTKSKAFKNTVKQCIYNKEVGMFMILVQGSVEILIYKDNGQFKKKLSTKQNQHGNPFNIVQIAYLHIEKRIIALLSTNIFCVWDYPNFDYELNINLKEYCSSQQIRILDSSQLQSFVTLNELNQLLIWDIKNPQNHKTINILRDDSNAEIVYFEEIQSLHLFVLVTNKNDLIFFDAQNKKNVLRKKLVIKPIINIQYSSILKSLVLVTHNNNIPVFKLTYQEQQFELNFIGRLIGHLNFVVCGCLIEDIHVLITIDEQVHIKFWDIIQMTCIRSVKVQGKARVTNLFFIDKTQKLVIFSKKINLYKVEKQIESKYLNKCTKVLDIFFDYENGQIDVFTNTDYQAIDQRTGKIKFIRKYSEIEGINKENQILEAYKVKVVDNGKNFYIFDFSGNSYLVTSFFKVKLKLIKQQGKVRKLFIVKKDYLFMTQDDKNITVQMNQKEDLQHNQLKTLRKLKGLQTSSAKIKLIEFSLDMNLVLISNQKDKIYVIDFEYCKVCGVLYFNNVNPLKAQMFTELGLILVYLEDNSIILLEFSYEVNSVSLNPQFKEVCKQQSKNLAEHGLLQEMKLMQDHYKITKNISDLKVVLVYEDGYIIVFSFKQNLNVIKEKNSYTKKNSYNSKRIMENNFVQNTEQNLKEFHFNHKKVKKRRNALTFSYSQQSILKEQYFFDIQEEFQIQKNKIKYCSIFFNEKFYIVSTNHKQLLTFKVHDLKGKLYINYDLEKTVPYHYTWKTDLNFTYKNYLKKASDLYRQVFAKPQRKTQIYVLREVFENILQRSPSKIFLADINHNTCKFVQSQPVLNLQYYDKYSLLPKKHQELFQNHQKYNLQKISNDLKQQKQRDWIFDNNHKIRNLNFQSHKQLQTNTLSKQDQKETKRKSEQKEKQEKIRQILFNQKNYEKTCEKFANINLNTLSKQNFQKSLRKKKKNFQKKFLQKNNSQKEFYVQQNKENRKRKSQFFSNQFNFQQKETKYVSKMQQKIRLTQMLKSLDMEVIKAKNKKFTFF